MGEWNVFWVDVAFWTGVAAAEGSEQASKTLGQVVQQVLQSHASATGATVGTIASPVTGGADDPGDAPAAVEPPPTLDGAAPALLYWSRGVLTLPPADRTPPADLPQAGSAGDKRPVILLSTDARGIATADPAELGAAVYRFIDAPGPPHLGDGHLEVRGGPAVGFGEECWVVWLYSLLRDPAGLAPAEISHLLSHSRLTSGDRQAPAKPAPVQDSELSVAGFLLHGGSFEETFVPAGPGQVSVLFGRNGAGKSLALTAIEQTLRALHDGTPDVHHDQVRPRCQILLQAAAQENAPRLFARILAYAGWGTGTSLPDEAVSYCMRKIPVRDTRAEFRPDDAWALPVDHAAALPLPQLRQTLAGALAASMPSVPGARLLADAIVATPALALSADHQVDLVMLPGEPGADLRAAASDYLAAVRGAGADDGPGGGNALRRGIMSWAAQLAGEQPGAPLALLSARLLPRTGWSKSGPSGWERLSQSVTEQVLGSIPKPVAFAPGQTTLQPADAAVEEAVLALLEHLAVLAKDAGSDLRHPFARHGDYAARLAQLLEHEANRLLPRFAADAGALRIRIADQGEWHAHRAAASFTGGIGGEVDGDALPSGLRTWVLGALSFARARLIAATWTGTSARLGGEFSWSPGDISARYGPGRRPTAKTTAFGGADASSLTPVVPAVPKVIYLLDEPEAHLHLTAQRDVVATAGQLAGNSCGVLAATHSLSFLDSRAAATHVVTLTAAKRLIRSSAWGGLRDLAAHARSLGITPSSLALACRGVLIVEGPQDREVIQRYGGVDLDQERILVIALHGVDYAKGIAELEFLHSFRIPLHVMFDHVSAQTVQRMTRGQRPGQGTSKEEHVLWTLREELRRRQLSVNVLPFPHVDIVRAVPESEIAWALEQLNMPPFAGWKDLDAHANAAWTRRRQPFKDTFRQVTGTSVEQVINCLARAGRQGPRSAELHELLTAMLAFDPAGKRRPGITTDR